MKRLVLAFIFLIAAGILGQVSYQLAWAQSAAPEVVPPKPTLVRDGSAAKSSAENAKTAAVPVPAKASDDKRTKPANRREKLPAKRLFGTKRSAASLKPRAIGFYARGCLAGGEEMPINGKAWQAMRLSRNRNWGHPDLIALLKKFAIEAQEKDGWPGLLVGDLAQPRGGPMLTGHRSHQIGLDADIWFTPMPKRRLTRTEREKKSAISMLAKGRQKVNPKIWTKTHVKLIKRIASYRKVQRVLVHPAIKKALCDGAAEIGGGRAWLNKVRPYWGHHYHFHVRIFCPPGSAGCRPQAPTPSGNTCGKELNYWLARIAPRKPCGAIRVCNSGEWIKERCQCRCGKKVRYCRPGEKRLSTCHCRPRPKKRQALRLAQLPQACRSVLDAPAKSNMPYNVPVPGKKAGN